MKVRPERPVRGFLKANGFYLAVAAFVIAGAGLSYAAVAKLAPRYVSTALGELNVVRNGSAALFDVGEWKSRVASRKNDDGTSSFLTIDPTLGGFEFVVADGDGRRRLVVRDAQHEYVFEEAARPAP